MEPPQQENYELQCRKLLLAFFSSELQAHSRLIIGFAVILLTLFQIRLTLTSILPIQSSLVYLGMFSVALAFYFSLMRLLTYGLLANAVIYTDPVGEGELLVRISTGTANKVLAKRILGCIPSCLFFSAGQKYKTIQRLIGIGLCALFALFTMVPAIIVMG